MRRFIALFALALVFGVGAVTAASFAEEPAPNPAPAPAPDDKEGK